MDKDIAISVKGVSKTFKIPHEKVTSIRGVFTSAFNGKRTFEEFKALDDVSFEVKKGEFFGIIGRNGSGKSTLLKVLAGIYQADKGKVKINGMISPFLELGIGFNPELSGRDNVYLNATVLGMTKKQIDEKFDSIVEFSELGRFIDQKLKNYSSGMQVRLAFSVSIHANRDILLMDEVLAVGDSNFQSKCLAEFRKYKEMGKTVILVTHDIATVQRYCDRAMLVRNGKIMKIGDAEEVVDEYINENIRDDGTRFENETSEVTSHEAERNGANKTIMIKRMDCIDSGGISRKTFGTGDEIEIRIHYVSREIVKNPVFGISIDSSERTHVTGPNTRRSGVTIDEVSGEGYVSLILQRCQLNAGIYFVTAGVFNWDESITYDFRSRFDYFQIESADKTQDGPFNVEIGWKHCSPDV
jgi:ABC-type polysaccharide/polyol phosphate transport system ATPase subunit